MEKPNHELEEILTRIQGYLLHLQEIGMDNNSFQLEGHSLTTAQLIAQLQELSRKPLLLQRLFKVPIIAQLSQEIAQVLDNTQGPTLASLQAVPRQSETLPLSYAQQRLWFLDQLESESAIYNSCQVLQLQGIVDVTALEFSFNLIVQRHEVLRTAFLAENGISLQKVLPKLQLSLSLIDLQQLPASERMKCALHLVLESVNRPFNLTRPPLLRINLLRLAPDEHIFALAIHHIIYDAWSWRVLSNELMTLYAAAVEGNFAPLPALPIQYADFALWQQQQLRGALLKRHLDYWTWQLRNVTLLQLPTDYPRPTRQTFRGAQHAFKIPSSLLEPLRQLCLQENVTLYMLLLATLQTLLYRYSGQTDIIVGTDIANRTRKELEDLIGFFVNILAIRVNFAGAPSFRELLKQVRQVTLEAYEHQDLPFEKLIEALPVQSDRSHSPLIQALLVFQNVPLPELEIKGLQATPLAIDNGIVRFDLVLFLEEREQENDCLGVISYKTDLFKEDTVVHMAASFLKLLQSIIVQPETSVDVLEYLTEEEKQQNLHEKQQRQESNIARLKTTRRKALHLQR